MKFAIMAASDGPTTGVDSAIIVVPRSRWYLAVAGEPGLVVQVAEAELRQLSHQFADQIGENLHHASWTLTSDPEQVTTLGLVHDCASCRAGVDQALAILRDRPDTELAVGQLWWNTPGKVAAGG